MAPLAALTMAALLFVYARTSIRAAKLNAQKHREADGGQISWRKESLRRHGQLEKVENDRGTLREALLGKKKEDGVVNVEAGGKVDEKVKTIGEGKERSEDERELRKMLGKKD